MNCTESFIGIATAVDVVGLTVYAQQAPQPSPAGIDTDGRPRTGGAHSCGGRQHEAEHHAQSA